MSLTLLHRIAATVLACIFFVLVLRLVRRKRLDTGLSVWWIIAGVVVVVLVWCEGILDSLATRMTLEVSSVILVGGILFLLFTCLHMSASITKLSQQIRQIGQTMALRNVRKNSGGKRDGQKDRKSKPESEDGCK